MNDDADQQGIAGWDRNELQHPDSAMREKAVAYLIEHPLPELRDDLAHRLGDDDENVQFLAVIALSMLGAAAVTDLTGALDESYSQRVRIAAANSLGRMGSKAQSAVSDLGDLLRDDNSQIRFHAGLALSQIGQPSVEVLIDVAEEEHHPGRVIAIEALARIGEPAENCIERLRDLSGLDDVSIRLASLNALICIQGEAEEDLDRLVEATEDPELAEEATTRIGELGERGRDAARRLRELTSDDASPVRNAAVLALVRINADDTESIEALVARLQDPDAEIVQSALRSLAHFRDRGKDALPFIQGLASHEDESIRETARAAGRMIQAPP